MYWNAAINGWNDTMQQVKQMWGDKKSCRMGWLALYIEPEKYAFSYKYIYRQETNTAN